MKKMIFAFSLVLSISLMLSVSKYPQCNPRAECQSVRQFVVSGRSLGELPVSGAPMSNVSRLPSPSAAEIQAVFDSLRQFPDVPCYFSIR